MAGHITPRHKPQPGTNITRHPPEQQQPLSPRCQHAPLSSPHPATCCKFSARELQMHAHAYANSNCACRPRKKNRSRARFSPQPAQLPTPQTSRHTATSRHAAGNTALSIACVGSRGKARWTTPRSRRTRFRPSPCQAMCVVSMRVCMCACVYVCVCMSARTGL
jgi:hypothetical protein